MKKVIDLAAIEAREKELEEELAKLRSIKKYATKFGEDYGASQPNGVNGVPDVSAADAENRVWSIITTLRNPEFNYPMIEEALVNSGVKVGRSSVFDAIASLKEGGKIEVVRKAAGRRPAQYKIAPSLSSTALNLLRKEPIE